MKQVFLFLVAALLVCPSLVFAGGDDWPSYNRSLTSERFVTATGIDRANVAGLKVTCTYETGIKTSFQTGPIVVDGTLYFTTEKGIFAVDAATCQEKWRVVEDSLPDSYLRVNRGVAFLDGRLFRGTQDGRVFAYDAATGKRLWDARIADPTIGESVPAAPIAWNGMVFVGNAGGDNKGVKGRMYALDAATGKQLWETYLVPKSRGAQPAGGPDRMHDVAVKTWLNGEDVPVTGGATWTSYTLDPQRGLLYVPGGNPAPDFASGLRKGSNLFTNSVVVLDAKTGQYRQHFSLVPDDFHDWDVSAAPTLFTARNGHRIMAAAPKDGHLYAYDLGLGKRLYRVPTTTIANAEVPLGPKPVRFCPGSQGGNEWNGPAYSPQTDLVYTGAVDWCATVAIAEDEQIKSVASGQAWSGGADPKAPFGNLDPITRWAGWLTASNAITGARVWRFRSPTPLLSGVTPTAGELVFFGDMAGRLYAADARDGRILWTHDTGGAIGGGVISYVAGGKQRIAVASGMTSPIWKTPDVTAKIVVFSRE